MTHSTEDELAEIERDRHRRHQLLRNASSSALTLS